MILCRCQICNSPGRKKPARRDLPGLSLQALSLGLPRAPTEESGEETRSSAAGSGSRRYLAGGCCVVRRSGRGGNAGRCARMSPIMKEARGRVLRFNTGSGEAPRSGRTRPTLSSVQHTPSPPSASSASTPGSMEGGRAASSAVDISTLRQLASSSPSPGGSAACHAAAGCRYVCSDSPRCSAARHRRRLVGTGQKRHSWQFSVIKQNVMPIAGRPAGGRRLPPYSTHRCQQPMRGRLARPGQAKTQSGERPRRPALVYMRVIAPNCTASCHREYKPEAFNDPPR